MLQVYMLILGLSINNVYSLLGPNLEYFQNKVASCNIGDEVTNECNKCMCTSKGIFECKSIECSKTKGLKDTNTDRQICIPNQLYVRKLITCICTKDGKWPHKSCQETFLSLPPSSVRVQKCEPNTYAIIDCNVCRCSPDGEFISTRCTKNVCEEDVFRRYDGDSKQSVFSNCMPKHWYSFAPCQFCYCINEAKLVCTTGHSNDKQLAVGNYHMEVCGTEMIAEALELVPTAPTPPLRQNAMNYNNGPTANPETVIPKSVPKKHKKAPKIPEHVETHDKDSISVEDGNIADIDNKDYVESEEIEKKGPPNIGSNNVASNGGPTVTGKPIKENNSEDSEETDNEDGDSNDSKGVKSNEMDEIKSSKKQNLVRKGSSNDIKMEKLKKKPTSMPSINSHDVEYTGNTLKIDVPSVLNKVIEMALRKSMVSISDAAKCNPGATSVNGCNVCFCLKNGKLLCTANKC